MAPTATTLAVSLSQMVMQPSMSKLMQMLTSRSWTVSRFMNSNWNLLSTICVPSTKGRVLSNVLCFEIPLLAKYLRSEVCANGC